MLSIETPGQSDLSTRQKWGHNLAVLFALSALFIGVNLRESALTATWVYVNLEAGIRSQYPQNWVIDTEGDYVFRVRDTSQIGYATTIQLSVQPVGLNTPARYIFDSLTLNRAQTLASYTVLSSGEPYLFPDETTATIMDYTFAASTNDPFLQSVPLVVRGRDILTYKRGQAIIITFLSNSDSYSENYAVFDRFINSLEF